MAQLSDEGPEGGADVDGGDGSAQKAVQADTQRQAEGHLEQQCQQMPGLTPQLRPAARSTPTLQRPAIRSARTSASAPSNTQISVNTRNQLRCRRPSSFRTSRTRRTSVRNHVRSTRWARDTHTHTHVRPAGSGTPALICWNEHTHTCQSSRYKED